MKSALANIGEKHLSAIALKLEHAGSSNELNSISSETPEFINELKSFLMKIKRPKADDGEDISSKISDEDMDFLRNKLNEVKSACQKLNLKEAKTALSELKKITWSGKINDVIDEISMYLIRGEYLNVASAVDKAMDGGNQG
jgi:soluble cytochrome b562